MSVYYVDHISSNKYKKLLIRDHGAVAMSASELSEMISTSVFNSVCLNAVDTFTIECVLQNHRINKIEVHCGRYDFNANPGVVDSMNNKQIIAIDFGGDHDYFISQLHKFEHLQWLEFDRDLNNQEASRIIDAIKYTNIACLRINLGLNRPKNNETTQQFSGLFTNTKLKQLTMTIAARADSQGLFIPIDLFDGLATNATMTFLYLQFFQAMPNEVIEHLSDAFRNNESIYKLDLSDHANKFDNRIITAICESKSIKHFETFRKYRDIDSFIYLVRHSKLTTLNMCMSEPNNMINEAMSENLCICNIDERVGVHDDVKKYLERNKRLRWDQTHACLVDFAMVFCMLFDPYVIVKIFDEMYEPIGANFYCARKIAVILSIRDRIEAIKMR